MSQHFCYAHPRPALTVDIVVLSSDRHVLLIRRKNEPFKGAFALPGGFMEIDETLADAAARELQEETGLAGLQLERLRVFDAPDRDPRGRTVSLAFLATTAGRPKPTAGDDADDARWLPLDDLPAMAFDHGEIIACALRSVARSASAAKPD